MKRNWWETENVQDVLFILSTIVAGCLLCFKNDFWIVYSALSLIVCAWGYRSATINKSDDVEYLSHRIEQLENHNKQLVVELDKAYKNSQQGANE